ncbi:hypothetical protein TEA_029219 [Camellia sinensis var. sinensis]|uniref:GOLD domain-containing protein n=1 Tax=Camellia sinensis var. sinensis TaxID=542762 RepID=A0A4S4EYR3_CAMSN|nr:hypothetical protein TEA_029219 [Camellia sinensis var. sinensis]
MVIHGFTVVSLLLLILFGFISNTAQSLRFDLQSGHSKCIAEDIKTNSMSVAKYSIVNPNDPHPFPESHKVTVRVTSAHGHSYHYAELVESGQFSFQAAEAGDYMTCFWALDHKPQSTITVDFDWKTGVAAKDWTNVAKKGTIDFAQQNTNVEKKLWKWWSRGKPQRDGCSNAGLRGGGHGSGVAKWCVEVVVAAIVVEDGGVRVLKILGVRRIEEARVEELSTLNLVSLVLARSVKQKNVHNMELELKKLYATVTSIHEEMFYLREREEEMQELNRRTNSRMGWLSILSLFVCLSVAGLQLWHLKTFFEKKKLI